MSALEKGGGKKPSLKKALILRVDLDESLKQQFETIKERHHLSSNTEVLRFCISHTYQNEDLDIPSELRQKINWIIGHPTIQEKHAIYDFNDYVRRALSFYLQQMKKALGDLNDWSFREQLQPDERDVATEIIQLQAKEENALGITFTMLLKAFKGKISEGKMSEERIREIVDKFLDLSVLAVLQHGDTVYYHTPQ